MRRDRGLVRAALVWLASFGAASAVAAQGAGGVDDAARQFERGEYAGAKATLLDAERANPGDARVSYYLGRILLAENRAGEATPRFERAVAGDGNRAPYRVWLSRSLMQQAPQVSVLRRPALVRRVKAELERAVSLEPANAEARFELLRVYLNAPGALGGSRDRALQQLAELRARDRYFAHRGAAEIARKDRQAEAAVRELRAAMAAAPDSIGAYEALAKLYEDGRRSGDAAEAYYGKGTVHQRLGQPMLARAAFAAALRLDPAHRAARSALALPERPQ